MKDKWEEDYDRSDRILWRVIVGLTVGFWFCVFAGLEWWNL